MSENASEKEHKPSSRRLEQLKKDGTFLRAREFSSGVALVAGVLLLMMLTDFFKTVLAHNFTTIFSQFSTIIHHDDAAFALYHQLAIDNFLLVLPVGLLLCLVVFTTTFLLGGFGFSTKLLAFKGERLSPLKNLKRLFSLTNVVEVMKSIFKFALFLGVLWVFIYLQKEGLFHLSALNRPEGIHDAEQFLLSFLIWMMFPILLIAAIDMLYNYYAYQQKIKMSLQELKDENKETEGNPEIKRRLRNAQRELLRRSIQTAVPQSTVIITNPTHYAVALRYHDNIDKAPKILAKGVDHMASEIRLLAIKNAIPIYESPQLARAIYFTGKVGAYIHADLYMAVAIVLSYVVQLKNYQRGLAQKPSVANDLQIPKSFHF
jgi:flagellar biosynthetic protein FlhB